MKIFQLNRLPALGHFLLISSDAVLWYVGSTLSATYGVAFLGVAAAWAAAILGVEAQVASRLYQQRKEQRAKQETVYAEFLASADEYAEAWREFSTLEAAYNIARSEWEAAKNRIALVQNYENQRTATSAETKVAKVSESLISARRKSDNLLQRYLTAMGCADQLASKRVQSALTNFNNLLTEQTSARNSARSIFIKTVRADLGQRHWPDKRTLPKSRRP